MAMSGSASHGSGCDRARRPRAVTNVNTTISAIRISPTVIGEQQQAEIDAEQEPIAALVLADGAPVMQQRQRPERRRQHAGTEGRARHGEDGDADHQQHGEHRMAGADDGAAEREHRPIGTDDAGLRQHIEPERAGQAEGDFAQPERQRRPEIAAEHEFMPDREQDRHVAGRRAVKQRGHEVSTAPLASAPADQNTTRGRPRKNSMISET